MNEKIKSYLQLMRFHKPIGTLLLLWPTLWALWISAHGFPSTKNLVIFVLGVIVMRAAGCVMNDFADRQFDAHVSRTKNRPLATGDISPRSALILFFILCCIAFVLILFTNKLTIFFAVFALLTAVIYPFMKRHTYWPQFILGIAFSFSIPMAFAAQTGTLTVTAGILMLTNIIWTIAYDTEYAMVDRNDDVKIDIKSTAILFGEYDYLIVGLLQCISIILLCVIGWRESFSIIYYMSIFVGVLLFLFQQFLIASREPKKYFRAFLNNHWFGLVIFIGILFTQKI